MAPDREPTMRLAGKWKTIRVARSVVTGIRIDTGNPFGPLIVEGVDQGSAGQTLQTHQLTFPPEVSPPEVAAAIATIRDFAKRVIDEA